MVGKSPIYLDYNATTPIDPRVLNEVMPYLTDSFGNASSRSHAYGWKAEAAVQQARKSLSDLLNCKEKELIWTSGATEAINLAIKGIHKAYHQKGNHIITVKTEHKAVLDVCDQLEKEGAEVTYLDVDNQGNINLEELEDAITPSTILVSIMWANNETGLIHPIKDIADTCHRNGTFLFCDATQAVGKIQVDIAECEVDLLACSGHKFYSMKGVGALYIRGSNPKIKVAPILQGGGHEGGRRSGTLNVPGIVSVGAAANLASKEMSVDNLRITSLRDQLEREILKIEETYLNCSASHRMGNVTNISFKYVESEALINSCNQQLAVATGSACTSASLEPSHVLLSMGLSNHLAHSAVRFSLGKYTTLQEIDRAIELIKSGVALLRGNSPVWEMFKDGVDVDSML